MKVRRKILRPLLDSGSGFSVISEKLATQLQLQIQPLEVGTARNLRTANGTSLDVLGSVDLPMFIKGFQFPQNALVVTNLRPNDFILGDDFMRSYNVILDYQNCQVSIEDVLCVPMYNEKKKDCFVRVIKPICISPYSVANVPISVSHKFLNQDCLVEAIPGRQFERFAVQRIAIHPKSISTVCRIMNFKPEPVVLCKGDLVASITTIEAAGGIIPESKPAVHTDINRREPSKAEIEQFIKDSGLDISDELQTADRERIMQLCYEYRDIFVNDVSKLKRLNLPPYKIALKDDRPSNRKQYKLSAEHAREADRQISELLVNKLVEPATLEGAVSYNTPLILVPKRNGEARLVCDFRAVNALITPFQVALPRIDDIVEQIASAEPLYLTSLDLKSGYWQVPIDESSRDILTFTNPLTGNKYRWTVAAFGMVNSGSYFCHSLNTVLSTLGAGDVATYVDDCLVFHKDLDQHIIRLREVFDLFRKYNVSVNASKGSIAHSSIEFCGHRVSKNSVEMVTKNRAKILENYPSPTTRKSLVRFLAMSSWFRKVIKNYAMRVTKMREIARKPDKEFAWTEEAEAELRDIISVLLSPPILVPVNPSKDFVLFVDASDFAVGYAIGQLDDNKEFRVNYYGGHQLPRPSLSWPIHHKEIFSAVSAIRSHEPMFVGKHITVVTDNCSLQNLKTMQNTSGRLQRWTSYLGNFDITYKHVPGHQNALPDAISRTFEDGSDEMRSVFTPSAVTDCSDYILSLDDNSDRISRIYNFVVVDEPSIACTDYSCSVIDDVSSLLTCPTIVANDDHLIVSNTNELASNTTGHTHSENATTSRLSESRERSMASTNKTVSNLNPNAEIFEPVERNFQQNENRYLSNETEDEFYDCVDQNLNFEDGNGINALTRNQTRLAVEHEILQDDTANDGRLETQ